MSQYLYELSKGYPASVGVPNEERKRACRNTGEWCNVNTQNLDLLCTIAVESKSTVIREAFINMLNQIPNYDFSTLEV